MKYVNPWPLLRAGKAEQEKALQIVRRWYAQKPSPSHAMELGVAFLWLGRYAEAWEHFRSVILMDPLCGDGDYGMAGAAKWCLDKPQEAVIEWKAGLEAKYARAAGLNVQMPLLLFFAAVL